MAKTAKLKSNAKSKSLHSRASKRESSPSLNLDKSLISLPRPEASAITGSSILSAQSRAGVIKRSKSKVRTRAQRLRQCKGMERAEIVMDKRERKVAKRLGREKTIKGRKTTWEELNRKPPVVQEKSHAWDKSLCAMDEGEEENGELRQVSPVQINQPAALAKPLPLQAFDEDGEIT